MLAQVGRLNRHWRRRAQKNYLIYRLTRYGISPTVVLRKKNEVYSSDSQLSMYELLCAICRHYKQQPTNVGASLAVLYATRDRVHTRIRRDPATYGRDASLNQRSPVFRAEQLRCFVDVIYDEFERPWMCGASEPSNQLKDY